MATSYNVNTDLVKGSSLLVYVGATPLAFAKSCDLSISADAITNNEGAAISKVYDGIDRAVNRILLRN